MRSPREVVEQVRRMVAGEGVSFADLFAEDGVLEYPFALPGQPRALRGREAIRAYFGDAPRSRAFFSAAFLISSRWSVQKRSNDCTHACTGFNASGCSR